MRSLCNATRLGSFLVLAGVIAFGAGCGDPNARDGEPVAQTSEALFGNDQTSFDYFVGKGLTAVQAAGIVGNLDQESGDDPTAVQYGGGPGRGVAQWSTGGRWDSDANDNENWFVTNKDGGSSGIWNLTPQLDFIWYELTNFPGYGLANLKSQTTVSGATTAFMTDFEICGTCDATNRINYAQAVYNAYGTAPSWGASFVSQSFPYATTTMMMTAGQVIPSYIELKNTGSATWDSNTKIGTTEPRDRTSAFADKTWVAPNRLARVSGTVPPGGTYKFTFDLAAPMTPGLYDEHFGVVEENVAWFSDPGQGGPPDSDLEVKIQVVAAPATSSSSSSTASSSSSTSSSSSGTTGSGGSGGSGGSASSGSTSSGSTTGSASTSGTGGSGAGGKGSTVTTGESSTGGAATGGGSTNQSSGCAVVASGSEPSGSSSSWLFGLMVAAGGLARRRGARRS